MKFFKLIYESFVFAIQALKANLLRTLLSLLGVTVGIFSIIGVLTMVDSLEANVKNALSSLGEKTIYIDNVEWIQESNDFPWWKYLSWPKPKYSEYEQLKAKTQYARALTIMDFSMSSARYKNSSFDALCQGITSEYNQISEVPVTEGRYFTEPEIDGGRNVAIIGSEVKETLFANEDALGKQITVKGQRFTVIGIQQKKGKQLVDVGGNPDIKVYIPFLKHKRMFSSGNLNGTIALQAFEEDTEMENLKSEVTGLMRTIRGLRPAQSNNFGINSPDAVAQSLGPAFDGLRVGGYVIGALALLIGGFGIANIMFVSVKERTNIIGIQKSLGAKNYFILSQFLFESVFLCLIGGLTGLLLVYVISFVDLGMLDLILTGKNAATGLIISSVIGIISGVIPASQAANMDPVIAMRSK
jgi:putative ABC transport system permease protein